VKPEQETLTPKNSLHVIFEDRVGLHDLEDFFPEVINWQPLYDLYVVKDEIVVTVELTGIEPKDIMIYAGKTYLLIKGVRKSPEYLDKDCCVFHNLEIPYGQFFRRIDLPLSVEPYKIRVRIENGLMTVRLPAVKEKFIPIE
jgi:HSP20 family molecular chaperone IbpA